MQEKYHPSLSIRKSVLVKPVYNVLVQVALKVSETRASSRADIRTLKSARAEAIKTVRAHFDAMILVAEQRRENLLQYKSIHFVSLGNDGFVDVLLSKWGFKQASSSPEEAGPFDAANCSAKLVATAIANNFKGFSAPLQTDQEAFNGKAQNLTILPSTLSSTSPTAKLDAVIPQQQRIENFLGWIESNEPQVFIYHSEDASNETQHYVQLMFDRLTRARKSKKTMCLWIYTPDPSSPPADWHLDSLPLTLQATYPMDHYTWNLPVHVFSGRGQTFEKNLISGIKILLEESGLQLG